MKWEELVVRERRRNSFREERWWRTEGKGTARSIINFEAPPILDTLEWRNPLAREYGTEGFVAVFGYLLGKGCPTVHVKFWKIGISSTKL